MSELKTISIMVECPDCKGTGLYVGFAERDGAAVQCSTCDGTGKYHFKYTYREFEGRKKRDDIKRVYPRSTGFVVVPEDITTKEGTLMPFSKWGVSYEKWLEGKQPPPIKELVCPAQWVQNNDDTHYDDREKFCKRPHGCGTFCSCEHFPNKTKCWELYDEIVK